MGWGKRVSGNTNSINTKKVAIGRARLLPSRFGLTQQGIGSAGASPSQFPEPGFSEKPGC